MSKKSGGGIVYSTNPNLNFREEESVSTPDPSNQNLFIQLETKHRGGKTVTIIWGFTGSDEALQQLGAKLKNHCGTGGTAKGGEIIVQGDHRQKVLQWLVKNGYSKSKIK